jgi:putative membrane protein
MSTFLQTYYLWFKVLHVVAFTSWMAGMFYLPRLYVYHTRVAAGSEADRLFQVMEAKLLRIIMNPAMILTFIAGGLMVVANPAMMIGQGWMHAKIGLVVAMAGCHGYLAITRKRFAQGQNHYPERFFKILNEVPTVIFIIIVILAVTRPF